LSDIINIEAIYIDSVTVILLLH